MKKRMNLKFDIKKTNGGQEKQSDLPIRDGRSKSYLVVRQPLPSLAHKKIRRNDSHAEYNIRVMSPISRAHAVSSPARYDIEK
mmetsp:Transcript_39046/g.44669  ORF Transcript_39046/g.44669 Transcript_39046/m.44669 type:complete len:83 (+) Transcript_39046:74-322(+)